MTLTGPGGVGKTRLAVAVGERLRDRFGAGTAFVPLAAVTDPGLVLAGVARAVGAELAGAGSPLEALAEYFGDGAWLLILDNLEQVVGAARDLDELLARCRGVVILATSRTVLGLRAEREYPVPPLPLPARSGAASVPLEELAASPAVALFVDRARAVRPGFALTAGNAAAVAEICRRLEGLPLAIELAAARTRLLDPGALLDRLAASLDALGTGAVDLPERQRTLRATVEWSVGLLDDAERSLLETVAVFVDGWTIEAAAQVAGLDEDRALELSEALARHSLVYLDSTEPGPRSRMLETVRAFVAERLAARPDAAEVGRRHAGYYRALAEQADRPLRGAGHARVAGAAGGRGGQPGRRRALVPGPRPRAAAAPVPGPVAVLVPAGPPGRGPLLGRAAAARRRLAGPAGPRRAGVDGGGDRRRDRATTRRRWRPAERLAPLLDGIEDPFLRAVCQLAMAWTSPITGDFDGALREASASLEQLRGQDEPVLDGAWPRSTVGSVETAVGRYDDALRHLREMRDLAERFDDPWLAAGSRVQLGILAVAQGRLDEARALLDEALDLSLAARSTRVRDPVPGRVRPAGAGGGRPRAGGAAGRRGRGPAPAGRPAGLAACCGGGRPSWWPRSARRWAPPGSTRRSPPAPGSPSRRRWPSSGTGAAPAPR